MPLKGEQASPIFHSSLRGVSPQQGLSRDGRHARGKKKKKKRTGADCVCAPVWKELSPWEVTTIQPSAVAIRRQRRRRGQPEGGGEGERGRETARSFSTRLAENMHILTSNTHVRKAPLTLFSPFREKASACARTYTCDKRAPTLSRQAQIAGSSLHAALSDAAGTNQRHPPAHRYGSLAANLRTSTDTHGKCSGYGWFE